MDDYYNVVNKPVIIEVLKMNKSFILMLSLLNTYAYDMPNNFNKVAGLAQSSTVNIQVVKVHKYKVAVPDVMCSGSGVFYQTYEKKTNVMGAGVLISSNGHILTNEHVIHKATKIEVIKNDILYSAVIIGSDEDLDIALIRIKGRFSFLSLADSNKVKVGDWAVAMGYPVGVDQTMTAGIISAINKSIIADGTLYDNLIQTDAAISKGNSGGPLLNIEGQIIGINTLAGSVNGVGFAIPSNKIKGIIKRFKQSRSDVSPADGSVYQPR